MTIAHLHRPFRQSVRHGITLLTLALFPLTMPSSAEEITVPITGTLPGGADRFPISDVGRDLNGAPFTLIYKFDDSKGKAAPPGNCPGSGSGITGDFASSPGRAVLTAGSKSFRFGERQDSHSSAWRGIASGCSDSYIGFAIREGNSSFSVAGTTIVNVRINGKYDHPLSRNPDWRASLPLTKIDDASGGFVISRVNDWSHEAKSSFDIETVMMSSAKSAARK